MSFPVRHLHEIESEGEQWRRNCEIGVIYDAFQKMARTATGSPYWNDRFHDCRNNWVFVESDIYRSKCEFLNGLVMIAGKINYCIRPSLFDLSI